jgi:hypothetical protein
MPIRASAVKSSIIVALRTPREPATIPSGGEVNAVETA